MSGCGDVVVLAAVVTGDLHGWLALDELLAGVVGWCSVKSAATPGLVRRSAPCGDGAGCDLGVWGFVPWASLGLPTHQFVRPRPLDASRTTTINHCNSNAPRKHRPWNAVPYLATTMRGPYVSIARLQHLRPCPTCFALPLTCHVVTAHRCENARQIKADLSHIKHLRRRRLKVDGH